MSQVQVVSLASRDADIAVRMSRPEGNSLIARKLPEISQGLFASVTYLGERKASEIDLSQERLIVFDDSYGRLPEMDWLSQMGLISAVAIRTPSIRAMLNSAISGGGIALLPAPFARRAGLTEIPLEGMIPSRAPWIVCHRDTRRLPNVAKVYGWIVDAFKIATGISSG
jgi:DNA-binding transcriptional LysR family regulator